MCNRIVLKDVTRFILEGAIVPYNQPKKQKELLKSTKKKPKKNFLNQPRKPKKSLKTD